MTVHPIFYCGCVPCKWACDNGNHRDNCPHDKSSEIASLRAEYVESINGLKADTILAEQALEVSRSQVAALTARLEEAERERDVAIRNEKIMHETWDREGGFLNRSEAAEAQVAALTASLSEMTKERDEWQQATEVGIAEYKAVIAKLTATEAKVAAWRECAEIMLDYMGPITSIDHACGKCRGATMVKNGFLCGPHKALALLSSSAPKEKGE